MTIQSVIASISRHTRRTALMGVLALAGLAIACTGAPTGAEAQDAGSDDKKPGRMTISGTGMVAGTPDIAHVSMGVTSEAETAREALSANNAAMRRVFSTLEEAGVEARDMQTSNFSISPRYKTYPRGTTGPRVIVAYSVSNTLTVTVRDLDDLGAILDATVSDGANSFYGLDFGFAEPQPMMDEARRKAVAEARRKAELLAEAAGVRLGRIIAISESGSMAPQPRMRAMAMEAADAVPIAAGESALSAQVSLTYELH